jgi:inosine triphosphate pyrophosphatase
MSETAFITGNPNKAAFLKKWLEVDLPHQKIELEEIQSLNLSEIVQHKAQQAFDHVKTPVLVEDVGLQIAWMGRLPGPFVKWFLGDDMGVNKICDMIPDGQDRSATSMVSYAWFDGEKMELFEGSLHGRISDSPRSGRGFGFDPIFIPEGSEKTHSEMSDDEIISFGLRTTTVYPLLRSFFAKLDK